MSLKETMLIQLRGSFISVFGGEEKIYGLSAVTRTGLFGVIFNPNGAISSMEMVHVPVQTPTRLLMSIRLVSGAKDTRQAFILQRDDGKNPFDAGTYTGRPIIGLPAYQPSDDAIKWLAQRIASAANAPIEPRETTLELTLKPWREAYQELTPAEQRIADVVVLVSQFENVLGPDAPHFNSFYSWVTVRAVSTLGCDELTPWSLPTTAE